MSQSNIGALVRAYEKAVADGFTGSMEAFVAGQEFRKSLSNLSGYSSNGTLINPLTLSLNRHAIPLTDGDSRNVISQLEYLDGWGKGDLYALWDTGDVSGTGSVQFEVQFANAPLTTSLNGFINASNVGVATHSTTPVVGAANMLQSTLVYPGINLDSRYPFRARLRRLGGTDTYTLVQYMYMP